jgi:uncharacterized protein DUF6011
MRCGKGHEHGTIAEVRACYGVERGESGATATATADYRANKFAGACVICGARVAEAEGRIVRRASGAGWDVSHLEGECPVRATAPAATDHADVPAPATDFSAVSGGYYATESLTGRNDFDFWFVREGTRNPRVRFVKRVIGGRGNERIHLSTARLALAAILAEGTDVTAKRFAEELGRCYRCGKHLTDETSRALGIGPVCRAGGRD